MLKREKIYLKKKRFNLKGKQYFCMPLTDIFFSSFKHKLDQIIWLTVDAACMQKKSEKLMQINRIKKIFGSGLKNTFQFLFFIF